MRASGEVGGEMGAKGWFGRVFPSGEPHALRWVCRAGIFEESDQLVTNSGLLPHEETRLSRVAIWCPKISPSYLLLDHLGEMITSFRLQR